MINEQSLQFNSVMDFSFSMEGRTAVSSKKLSALFELSIEDLKLEAKGIDRIDKLLFITIAKMVEDPDCIMTEMGELDPLIFSRDQNWQKIIVSLNECGEELNSVRTIALTKYMQYLSAINDVIEQICKERKESLGAKMESSENEQPDFGATWGPGDLPLDSQNDPEKLNDFVKLPKNKTVELTLSPGKHMDMLLATHMCKLVSKNNHIQFIDKDMVVTLNEGRSVIGRSTKSTIQIDATQKDVSREHLAVQLSGANLLQLTDLSSAGSFIDSTIPIS